VPKASSVVAAHAYKQGPRAAGDGHLERCRYHVVLTTILTPVPDLGWPFVCMHRFAAIAALALSIAAGGCQQREAPPSPSAAVPSASATTNVPVGAIDSPADEALWSRRLEVSGWALDHKGIADVAAQFPDFAVAATYGLPRPDVASVKGDYSDAASSGFAIRASLDAARPLRLPFRVVAKTLDGRVATLGRRSVVPPEAMQLWSDAGTGFGGRAFHFLMATSGVASGGAGEVDTAYRGYGSTTQRVGIAVPILYLRTTHGRGRDWTFDPDFDTRRKCGERRLVDDSLREVLQYAVAKQLPVHFILNGGIWADAACNVPEWDLNDHLEEDPRNCQWTQDDAVPADDFLKSLAGSMASPELARSLTLNVYAHDVRRYKRRNLQAAAALIADFARSHPALFVGVNLDSDTYVNPFFEQREWFDYNPGTLRQFREWLRGGGPYAGQGGAGVPDLRAFRRAKPLTLADVNRLARAGWTRWDEVQPPRGVVREAGTASATLWDDPWFQEWDTFRKHLVALHYDDLARWTNEAGIDRDRIFTAQGFVAPEGDARPFAIRVTSAGQNYDTGGVSVEGAIPRHGHLGAILYGPAAENRVRMEHRHGLFATFARMDPAWAVVESNLADLKRPETYPDYANAYRAFRDLFNFDARQVSLMAWNGSNGIYAGQPGYVSYTSWRNTPAEEAMRDHLVSHAGLPVGSRLWTFGSAQHADDDGWSVEGATLRAENARLALSSMTERVALVSPPDQVIRRRNAGALILGVDAKRVTNIEVFGELSPGSGWQRLGTANVASSSVSMAGVRVPLAWPETLRDAIVERLRIVVTAVPYASPLHVDRVALVAR
jgi:hypothetical protein